MTEYRAGQRVRIEWPNGDAVEGVVRQMGWAFHVQIGDGARISLSSTLVGGDGRTATVLAEPRPEEPTGLGAVVEADDNRPEKEGRTRWVRFRGHGLMALPEWCTEDGCRSDYWTDLIDPVVLHEGWTP